MTMYVFVFFLPLCWGLHVKLTTNTLTHKCVHCKSHKSVGIFVMLFSMFNKWLSYHLVNWLFKRIYGVFGCLPMKPLRFCVRQKKATHNFSNCKSSRKKNWNIFTIVYKFRQQIVWPVFFSTGITRL